MSAIRTRYEQPGTRPVVSFKKPSMTFQSEKDGTMIEAYLRKFRATGFLGDPERKARAVYGDFTGIEDFQTIQQKMAALNEYFMSLPSNVRRFFGDEPGNYVSWITDPRNHQKAVDMGLLSVPQVDIPSAEAEQPAAAQKAAAGESGQQAGA